MVLSDTHELHRSIDVPDGDILIHCGDWSMFGRNQSALDDFADWIAALPHRYKVLCPGNHEYYLEHSPSRRNEIPGVTVLINEGITIEGLRLWVTPATTSKGAAFGVASAQEREHLYRAIPDGIDVLITHGPPYGILDGDQAGSFHAGCRELHSAVERIRPKLHVFGHVHGAHGIVTTPTTTYVNACLMSIDNGLDFEPVALRMQATED